MPIPNHVPTAGRVKWYSTFSAVLRDQRSLPDLRALRFAAAFVIGYGC